MVWYRFFLKCCCADDTDDRANKLKAVVSRSSRYSHHVIRNYRFAEANNIRLDAIFLCNLYAGQCVSGDKGELVLEVQDSSQDFAILRKKPTTEGTSRCCTTCRRQPERNP